MPHDVEADQQADLLSALALFFSLFNALTSGLPQRWRLELLRFLKALQLRLRKRRLQSQEL